MARFDFTAQVFLLSFATCLLVCSSGPVQAPQVDRVAGVFMLIEGGEYTFNFSAASAACLFLNVTIATRAQMERAVLGGLQTCKFGWTAERVAVIPRITPSQKCGSGGTGVVMWYASADKKFAVFCFNASDSEETPSRSTAGPQSSMFSTTLPALTQTSTPTTRTPKQTSLSAASTLRFHAARSTQIPSTSSTLKISSTHIPTSVSQLLTSKPTGSAFASSAAATSFSTPSESVPSVKSPTKSLGDVPAVFIILSIILLLLTAAGVMWYYKINIFSCWPQRPQKDDTETEMWKHADSEMDLHSQHEGDEDEEEDESDRKYSSEITLCVNPDTKAYSSE
ncbi:uncharacterized protein V6R79_024366 [Siganus canaliculatus]